MKREFDGASVRAAWWRLVRLLAGVCSATYAACRTAVARAGSAACTGGRRLRSGLGGVGGSVAALREARWTRTLVRRLSRGTVGVRRDVSALAVVAAPLLTVVTERWVASSYGYPRVHSWVVGTWTGVNPQPVVFAGVVAFAALPVAFTVYNSGLIPATLLAMAPLFGVGFARYGHTVEHGTVGIPEATAFGGFVAVSFGVPLGVAAFVVGTALHAGVARFGDGGWWERTPWEA